MVKGDEFWETFTKTMKECDKQCNKCAMYLKHKNKCIHASLKSWSEWNKRTKQNAVWNKE